MTDLTEYAYDKLNEMCSMRGYLAEYFAVLAYTVMHGKIYAYRRRIKGNWYYEAVLPGYGKEPNMDKWIDTKIIE